MVPEEIKSYRDLIVWQKGIQLAKQVYQLTSVFPKSEIYGLTSQMRRCAVSIPSNIAEGQSRRSTTEFKQFLRISLGSLSELDTQMILATEFEYLTVDKSQKVNEQILEMRRLIYGLLNKLPTTTKIG
jgi:four helix bundle protein